MIKTIIKKPLEISSAVSFDSGEVLSEKKIPINSFVQIIDGQAEVVINGNSSFLETGQSKIIPAHSSNIVKVKERFKMISLLLKVVMCSNWTYF